MWTLGYKQWRRHRRDGGAALYRFTWRGTSALAGWFKANGADVTPTERAGGHGLQSADIEETRAWLANAA